MGVSFTECVVVSRTKNKQLPKFTATEFFSYPKLSCTKPRAFLFSAFQQLQHAATSHTVLQTQNTKLFTQAEYRAGRAVTRSESRRVSPTPLKSHLPPDKPTLSFLSQQRFSSRCDRRRKVTPVTSENVCLPPTRRPHTYTHTHTQAQVCECA